MLWSVCVLLSGLAAAGNAVIHGTPNAPTPVIGASRIAALAPSLTELVFAAGAGHKVVAASSFSNYPLAARALPQVADHGGINIEALLGQRPDLVLVWTSGTRETDIERLVALGIRTERISIATLADIPVALRRIGDLAGTAEFAGAAADKLEARLAGLRERFQLKSRVSVFIEIGRAPLMTVNANHFISEVVRLCGGTNIFADRSPLVFQPSREQLIARQPDVVVFGENRMVGADRRDNDDVYAALRVRGQANMLGIESDQLLRPGPRLIDAADSLCQRLDEFRLRLKR